MNVKDVKIGYEIAQLVNETKTKAEAIAVAYGLPVVEVTGWIGAGVLGVITQIWKPLGEPDRVQPVRRKTAEQHKGKRSEVEMGVRSREGGEAPKKALTHPTMKWSANHRKNFMATMRKKKAEKKNAA